jgi:hypothetical protein
MADRKSVIQFKIRIRKSLRQSLERAAKAADRSANEEAEFRLERSFAYDRTAGEPWNLELARNVSLCASLIEKGTGKGWLTDFATRQRLLAAVQELVEATDAQPADENERVGRTWARIVTGRLNIQGGEQL